MQHPALSSSGLSLRTCTNPCSPPCSLVTTLPAHGTLRYDTVCNPAPCTSTLIPTCSIAL